LLVQPSPAARTTSQWITTTRSKPRTRSRRHGSLPCTITAGNTSPRARLILHKPSPRSGSRRACKLWNQDGQRDLYCERSDAIALRLLVIVREPGESALGVRREKAALSSGCESHPATAPAGSNRSSYGGDEVAEAFGKRVTKYGDSASVMPKIVDETVDDLGFLRLRGNCDHLRTCATKCFVAAFGPFCLIRSPRRRVNLPAEATCEYCRELAAIVGLVASMQKLCNH
jgi:hypothetical protein